MNPLLALLAFQLVYVVNQIHFPFETGIPGVAAANVLLILIAVGLRSTPDQLQAKGILRTPMLIFFGVLTFSFIWGQLTDEGNLLADATYLKNAICFPLFYFIYLKSRQDEKGTRLLIILVMVIAAVAGLEGIREGLDYGFGKYNQFRRASGPFGVDWRDANRAGVFYGMYGPMFVALALFLRGKVLMRLSAIGSIFLLAGGALFTYSRQAYGILVLGSALALLRKNVVLAAIIGVALTGAVGFLPDSVFQRVEETHQEKETGEHQVDDSTASRWEIWAGAMQMWSEHPMGVGVNHFKQHIGDYCKFKGMDAHNFYVLTLAETGPVGLASFLFVLFSCFRLAFFMRKHRPADDPELDALTLGFVIMTLCMALGGLYGSPHFEGSVMGTYWALCGLLERTILLRMQAQEVVAVERTAEPTLAERFPLAARIYGPTSPSGNSPDSVTVSQ